MLGKIEENRSKTYLNIKDGAIIKRTPEGEEKYSYVEGTLTSITQRERTFRNEVVLYWYIDLRDKDSGELYSLGFPYGSNTFKSIILQLANNDGLKAIKTASTIRIEPYTKNGYDKVQVWGGGVKLDWVIKELPPIKETVAGGKRVKDDSNRMAFIASLSKNIISNITTK